MTERENYSGGAAALATFASIMLMVVGAFQFVAGLAAVFNDEKFIITEDYVVGLDTSAWGWIHLLMGVLLFFAGISLLKGSVWARAVAVFVASLSAITAFVWLPAQPFWGLLIIILDVFIIWAVTAHGRDVTKV